MASLVAKKKGNTLHYYVVEVPASTASPSSFLRSYLWYLARKPGLSLFLSTHLCTPESRLVLRPPR